MIFLKSTFKYTLFSSLIALAGCGANSVNFFSSLDSDGSKDLEQHGNILDLNSYSSSGTITISYPISKLLAEKSDAVNKLAYKTSDEYKDLGNENSTSSNSNVVGNSRFAPTIGFVPVHATFQPAENEVWIEIDREKSKLNIYKGKEKLKELATEGKITLTPGQYPIQHKQKSPLWYAPDEYFEKRQLRVPPRGDHFRYRRGALGQFALYPTMDFIIHCGPIMSDEIGGLRVNPGEMPELFGLVNIGSSIVIK